MSSVSTDSHYGLVENEVISVLRNATQDELTRLRDEIHFRVENNDPSIDAEFMGSILRRIPDILEGREIRPAHTVSQKAKIFHSSVSASHQSSSSIEDRLLAEEIRKGLEDGEEVLESDGHGGETHNASRTKYPKFFNKVKWGVIWNKYAQTHYDPKDNPPPRQILGYKFNIFYPDLADTSVAPRYKLENAPDTMEYLILRFIAGRPYEDIIFRIVNKEWDLDKRNGGFHCQFERGVLHLYFNFKRDRYRR